MKLWVPAGTTAERQARWQTMADRAAFGAGMDSPQGAGQSPFTRTYGGGHPYTLDQAVVLSAAEHRLLTEASTALAAILSRVVAWVQRNPVLLPVLGIVPELEAWVTYDPEVGPFSLYARLDWMMDREGRWWCLECNADTPGGLPEATVWQPLAAQDAPPGLLDPNRELRTTLGECLRQHLRGTAGFFTSPSVVEDWENLLAAATAYGGGCVAAGGMPVVADGTLYVDGQPVDSLYRFYPGDWLVRQPALLSLLSAGFPGVNPGSALIAQSKALFALLHHLVDEGQFLTPAEREWVTAFIPRTALTRLDGPWVSKPYWEREGAGVAMGGDNGSGGGGGGGTAGPAAGGPPHPVRQDLVFQRRIDPFRLSLTLADRGTPLTLAAVPVVGVYLVGGRPAGYMTRLGGPVTDVTALFAPTLVADDREKAT